MKNIWVISGLCVSLVAVAIGLLLFQKHYRPKNSSSTAFITTNDGLPHTLQEVNADYAEIPAQENAATYYIAGFNSFQAGYIKFSDLPAVDSPLSPRLKTVLTSFVESNRAAFESFDQGARHERCRYPIDLTRGFSLALPHLVKVRAGVQSLAYSAILHAENRKAPLAAHDLLTMLALVHSLEYEPANFSQTVRVTETANSMMALSQVLSRVALPSESLTELSDLIQKMEACDTSGEAFNRSLATERLITRHLVDGPQDFVDYIAAPTVDIPAEFRERLLAHFRQKPDTTEEIKYWEQTFQQFMNARKVSLPARLNADDFIARQTVDAAEKKFAVLELLMPAFSKQSAREARSVANTRLGLTAIALARYSQSNGNQFPSALSELTPTYLPAVPTDPFDGQPLRYLLTKDLCKIYSIGPDLKDSLGEQVKGTDDIMLELAQPPKQ